jgi:hypothetical protein
MLLDIFEYVTFVKFTQVFLSCRLLFICKLKLLVVNKLMGQIKFSFIIPRVVQIMSIIFQTGHELSIVLGNESTSASARVRFASTIE